MYFLAASIGDVSDCNQFLQERSCLNTRAQYTIKHLNTIIKDSF